MHPNTSSPARSAPPAAGWCLRFLSGALRGRTISLKPGANVLGSAGDCDVMLPSGDVQSHHLQLNIGELLVSAQKLGAASAQLNGEEMPQQRRSVLEGDVISVAGIDFQLDRNQPVQAQPDAQDSMFMSMDEHDALAAQSHREAAAPVRRKGRWVGGGVAVAGVLVVLGLASWDASGVRGRSSDKVNLQEVERVLAAFPEVEAVAGSNGSVSLRGYVESRARKQALKQAIEPFGAQVTASVLSADEMIEQARRFISDPGVSIAYTGHGRLVVSGTSEDDALKQQVRRLSEDLHPVVLVSDKVQYRAKTVTRDENAERSREQWAAWQNVLPSRMVGITEDASGMRHIQLANGSRYYEGSVLRSGAELTRIEADGLVVSGGDAAKKKP
jgi:type III secretion system YscD/HrpQ family protein